MTTIEELTDDLGELCMLCNQARRPRVKDRLNAMIHELEAEIREVKSKANEERKVEIGDNEDEKTAPTRATKKISSYGWDQSDKFAKIYVTAKGVHTIDKSQVKCTFGPRSVTLAINDLNGANHVLEITNLHDYIVPGDSHHKVKTDNVLVMLKKAKPDKSWSAVVKKLYKVDDYKPATDDDPSAGLMSLMKKMYDEGDDDMKRTINKAWAESREKQDKGIDDL